MNLSTARSVNRAREVAIRKTVGSIRPQLIRQFLAETIILSFAAVLIALIFIQFVLPIFDNITGKDLAVPYFENALTIPALLGVALFIGILAGIYPALFLSAFDPAVVLKSETSGKTRKSSLRNALFVFQFTVSIILIVGTFIVNRQLKYIQNKNLGFNKDQIVVVKKTDDLGNQIQTFRQELLTNPRVLNASNTGRLIGESIGNSAFKMAGETG